jgi:hypothetical protein
MKLVVIGAAIVVGIFSGAALAQDVSLEAPIIDSPLLDSPLLGGIIEQPAISLPLLTTPIDEPAEDLSTVLRGTKTGPVPGTKTDLNVVADPGKLSVTRRSGGVLGPGQLSSPTAFEKRGGSP